MSRHETFLIQKAVQNSEPIFPKDNQSHVFEPNTKEHFSDKTIKLFKTFDLSPQIKVYVQLQSEFRKYLPQTRSKPRFVCEIYPTAF